jgi:hypothetical protein
MSACPPARPSRCAMRGPRRRESCSVAAESRSNLVHSCRGYTRHDATVGHITRDQPMLRRTPLGRRTPLRARKLYRPPPRAESDKVTPEQAIAIFKRDGGCLAPRLGGSAMDCWGRDRIEHVKREARMGKRGDLLGTLCQGHTEDGMRAGYIWCTDAENRRLMREHLESIVP